MNVNQYEQELNSIQVCLNHEFLLEQLKSCQGEKNLTQRLLRGPTTWKDMLEHALNDTSSWHTKRKSEAALQSFNYFLG